MRRVLLAALAVLVCVPVFAQSGVDVETEPTGSCGTTKQVRIFKNTGKSYTCKNGVWTAEAGGGEAGDPAGSPQDVQINDTVFGTAPGFTANPSTGEVKTKILNGVRIASFDWDGDTVLLESDDIQLAINDASSAGKRVYLPAGTFTINNPLRVPSGVELFGDGDATVLRAKTNLNDNVLTNLNWNDPNEADTGVWIHHLKIDGNKANQSGTNGWSASACPTLSTQNTLSGILLAGVTKSRVDHVTVIDAKSVGIWLTVACSGPAVDTADNLVTNNIVTGFNDTGIRLDGSAVKRNTVADNLVRDQGTPVAGSGGAGIRVDANVSGTVVTGNQVTLADGFGIRALGSPDPSSKLVVAGNLVTGTALLSGASGHGISIGGSYTTVSGNVSDGNAGIGIDIGGGSGHAVTGNSASGNTSHGIGCASTTDSVFSGNTAANNDQGATGASGLVIAATCSDLVVVGNNGYDDQGSPTQEYGVRILSGASAVAMGNYGSGNVTSQVSFEGTNLTSSATPMSFPIPGAAAGGEVGVTLTNSDTSNEESSPQLQFINGGPGRGSEKVNVGTDGAGTLHVLNNAGTSRLSVTQAGVVTGTSFVGPLTGASSDVACGSACVSVAEGGTGIASGTSGGVPYYSGSTTVASSGALASGQLVLGGGAGAAPTSSTCTGSSGQLDCPADASVGGSITLKEPTSAGTNCGGDTRACEFQLKVHNSGLGNLDWVYEIGSDGKIPVDALQTMHGGVVMGTDFEIIAGAGLNGGGTGYSPSVTLLTASDEPGFLSTNSITCGASNAGRARVTTTGLEFCDGQGTPVLQRAVNVANPGMNGRLTWDWLTNPQSDDLCTGDKGELWFDDTDNAWKACNVSSSERPIVFGGGRSHATDCTSYADGLVGQFCTDLDNHAVWVCDPDTDDAIPGHDDDGLCYLTEWKQVNPAGGSVALTDLSDVTSVTPPTGSTLIKSAGDWVHGPLDLADSDAVGSSVLADANIAATIARDSELPSGADPAGHTHTTTSVSGLDVSADTNLAVTSPIVLTDDTISIANADDDGATKGAATFADADFDCTTGSCSIAAAITRDADVPSHETDPGVPLLALADHGDLCAGNEAVRRNAGDTANECFTPAVGGGDSITVNDPTPGAVVDPDFDDATPAAVSGANVKWQYSAPNLSAYIIDATTAAKGVASYTAADFDVTSGAVSIDYTNGTAATGSVKGFLTAADWTTFNNKLSSETGDISAVGAYSTGAAFADETDTAGATVALTWEGDTVDTNEWTMVLPADPGADAVVTMPTATTTVVGHDTTNTLTNKTISAADNTLTTIEKVWFPAAGCNNATATSFWDLPTSNPGAAACITGTNTQKGVLDFDQTTDESAQSTIMLPADWTGNVDATVKWLTSATSGSVAWCVQLICVADEETDDPSFPAQATGNCATDTAKGTTLQTNDVSLTSITATGCAAGELMHIRLSRDPDETSTRTDTVAADARLIGVEMTLRRAQ